MKSGSNFSARLSRILPNRCFYSLDFVLRWVFDLLDARIIARSSFCGNSRLLDSAFDLLVTHRVALPMYDLIRENIDAQGSQVTNIAVRVKHGRVLQSKAIRCSWIPKKSSVNYVLWDVKKA
jgi:hypothetical protein